ncbi:MAG: hypothetical protein WAT81_03945 [Candidatus Moraniibacteriota bacterium]
MATEPSALGTITNVRSAEQFARMQATVGQGICPFCDPERYTDGKILREGDYWRVIHNDFPHKHHRYHILVVPIDHVTDISEINAVMWTELLTLFQWAVEEFQIPGGGLVMRFGDPAYNAGTVAHYHVNIQVPDLTGPAKATFTKDPSPEAVALRAAKIAGFADTSATVPIAKNTDGRV